MKVNLLIDNPADARPTHINIDAFAPENDPARIQGNVTNLNDHVDDAEAEEILAHDIIDYFPPDIANEILKHWVSKLAHGGQLVVSCLDIREVARVIASNVLPLEAANKLIHGEQGRDWDVRKSSFTTQRLVEVLKALGLKIIQRRVRDFRSYVTAQRT